MSETSSFEWFLIKLLRLHFVVFWSLLRKLFPFFGVSYFVENLITHVVYGPYFSNCKMSTFFSLPDEETVGRQVSKLLKKNTVQLKYIIRMCFTSGCSHFHCVMDWYRDGCFKKSFQRELSTSIKVHPFPELFSQFIYSFSGAHQIKHLLISCFKLWTTHLSDTKIIFL